MTEFSLSFDKILSLYLIPAGLKLAGAIAVWVIGGWLISILGGLTSRSMVAQKVDPTLIKYIDSILRGILRLVLIIAIFGVFGVETTSFAALLAAAGIAIGAAWSGLLANFAAGAFLVVLRPFRVGEWISVAGVTGEVKEIGMFATTLDTPDSVRVTIGNNKIFSDNIVNYSHNAVRRVDLKAQIANGVDPKDAIARLSARIAQIPNVAKDPAPSVEILEFNAAGTLLAVRPYTNNKDYWQVYFDTNKAIQEVGSEAGYPVPAPHQVLVQK